MSSERRTPAEAEADVVVGLRAEVDRLTATLDRVRVLAESLSERRAFLRSIPDDRKGDYWQGEIFGVAFAEGSLSEIFDTNTTRGNS
jgi:hypothetical protein